MEFHTTVAKMRELLPSEAPRGNYIVRGCVRRFLQAHPELPGDTLLVVTPTSVDIEVQGKGDICVPKQSSVLSAIQDLQESN